MADTKQIVFTPSPVTSKADPELAAQLHQIHQMIFNRFQNHKNAVANLQAQIDALKAAQGKK